MATVDPRQPAVVRDAFHRRVAAALAPHGFVASASATRLKRKVGARTDLIDFSSSHYNAPGSAVCFVALHVEDARVRKQVKGWRTGGVLTGPHVAAEVPTNVAVQADADRLLAEILDRLAFFELLAAPERALAEVRRRYVPGFLQPIVIAPYLATHLGAASVRAYAEAVLAARPELWPGFLGPAKAAARTADLLADHGAQLAVALAGEATQLAPPAGTARAGASIAAHQRDFVGLQLRAWGEPEAAAALARLDDAAVAALRDAQEALGTPLTTDRQAARLALAATGADRAPRRKAPSPVHFQYHARHATFARS